MALIILLWFEYDHFAFDLWVGMRRQKVLTLKLLDQDLLHHRQEAAVRDLDFKTAVSGLVHSSEAARIQD